MKRTKAADVRPAELPREEAPDACHDDEFTSFLGLDPVDPAVVGLDEDCLPADMADLVEAQARARVQAILSHSAELAREVYARAEQDVRDVLGLGLPEAESKERSRDLVVGAAREVRQIQAQGRAEAEVVEMRARQRATELREPALVEPDGRQEPESAAERPMEAPMERRVAERRTFAGSAAQEAIYATLSASALASDDGTLRYRVAGSLTLATMLAFEQAVSRLPGATLVSVTPEPNEVAILSLAGLDPTLAAELLRSLPGIDLEIVSA